MDFKAINATDVAKCIVSKCIWRNKPINNLTLQNLLYYVQLESIRHGFYAFEDDFEAWQFGPVIPAVYYRFCGFGANPIWYDYEFNVMDKDLMEIIDNVIEKKSGLMIWDYHNELQGPDSAHASVYKPGKGDRYEISKHLIKKQAMTKNYF